MFGWVIFFGGCMSYRRRKVLKEGVMSVECYSSEVGKDGWGRGLLDLLIDWLLLK